MIQYKSRKMRIDKNGNTFVTLFNKAKSTTMTILRNTILILLMLTPITIYALESRDFEEVIPVVLVEEVEEPIYEYTIDDFKRYATVQVTNRWGEDQVEAFIRIINKESSWIVNTAHYSDGKSSAYGFGGFLDATWETVGCEKTSDQFVQIDCAIEYIAQRPLYGTPVKALVFHDLKNWY